MPPDRCITLVLLISSVVIHQTQSRPERSAEVSMIRIGNVMQHLKVSTFYEKLQSLVAEYVRQFEDFGEITILTAEGYKTIPFNEEMNSVLDKFMSINLQLEYNRAVIHDPDFLLAHPVNLFRFVRNNTIILDNTIEQIHQILHRYGDLQNAAKLKFFQSILENENYFKRNDMNKTLHWMLRYQYAHKLKTSDMAHGKVLQQHGESLSARECAEVAMYARTCASLQVYAATWMEMARQMAQQEDTTVDTVWVLETLITMYRAWRGPCLDLASQLHTQLITINPNTRLVPPPVTHIRPNSQQACLRYINTSKKWNQQLRKFCRGNTTPSKKTKQPPRLNYGKDLICQTVNQDHKMLYFQPLKLETVMTQPSIFIIHDFISEKESTVLKQLAAPKLQRAAKMAETGLFPMKKKSYSTDLQDTESKIIVKSIQSKIAMTADLDLGKFREFRIVKYAVEHATNDTDHQLTESELKNIGEDCSDVVNKHTAAVFVSLREVEAGGETVFPMLGIKIRPQARAALFVDYINLDGAKDDTIMHGSCPVTKGEKWMGIQKIK